MHLLLSIRIYVCAHACLYLVVQIVGNELLECSADLSACCAAVGSAGQNSLRFDSSDNRTGSLPPMYRTSAVGVAGTVTGAVAVAMVMVIVVVNVLRIPRTL